MPSTLNSIVFVLAIIVISGGLIATAVGPSFGFKPIMNVPDIPQSLFDSQTKKVSIFFYGSEYYLNLNLTAIENNDNIPPWTQEDLQGFLVGYYSNASTYGFWNTNGFSKTYPCGGSANGPNFVHALWQWTNSSDSYSVHNTDAIIGYDSYTVTPLFVLPTQYNDETGYIAWLGSNTTKDITHLPNSPSIDFTKGSYYQDYVHHPNWIIVTFTYQQAFNPNVSINVGWLGVITIPALNYVVTGLITIFLWLGYAVFMVAYAVSLMVNFFTLLSFLLPTTIAVAIQVIVALIFGIALIELVRGRSDGGTK